MHFKISLSPSISGDVVQWLFYFMKRYWACDGNSRQNLFILLQLITPIELCMSLKVFFYKVSFVYVKTNFWSRSYGKRNSRCYGRCYVNRLTLCVLSISHSSRGKLARSFQNGFGKSVKVLIFCIWFFHEHHHILGYYLIHFKIVLLSMWDSY